MTRAVALLRGIDRAAFAVSLVTRLRTAGVTAGFTATESLVSALAVAQLASRSQLYWAARICLVRRHSELAAFDAVFDAVFADAVLTVDPHARRNAIDDAAPAGGDRQVRVPKDNALPEDGVGLPWVTLPPAVAAAEDSDSELTVPQRLPGELAGLADTPFEQLSMAEMALLGRWLETAIRSWPQRRTRRLSVERGGRRIAMRATIERSRRTAWEAVELVRAEPVVRPRRVVMLCDVSQSMQAQAAAYLHLMRALAVGADAEVFAFATSLTRLTGVLTHRSPEVAIEQASAKVVDRFGGTRIATNVQALLTSHHGGAVRGAVVIVGSDGWDSDPPEKLAAAMARLNRRAYRVIWMNPRAAAPGFEPRVGALAAAMPYCDRMLPADTFAQVAQVIAEIAVSSRASRGSRAGTCRQ